MSEFGIPKRSVAVAGQRTSISLDDGFYDRLGIMAKRENISVNDLVTRIAGANKSGRNLSSAIRVTVLRDLQDEIARYAAAATQAGRGRVMGALQVVGWLVLVAAAFGVGVWVGQMLGRPAGPEGATFAQASFPLLGMVGPSSAHPDANGAV